MTQSNFELLKKLFEELMVDSRNALKDRIEYISREDHTGFGDIDDPPCYFLKEDADFYPLDLGMTLDAGSLVYGTMYTENNIHLPVECLWDSSDIPSMVLAKEEAIAEHESFLLNKSLATNKSYADDEYLEYLRLKAKFDR